MEPFEPAAYPALLALGEQLRGLAGDAAYAAGRKYLQQGVVGQGTVAGAGAFATVTGSTDYRVRVTFGDEVKVSCTCPAHRRSKFCKHVVAVCVALLERPSAFTVSEAVPEPPAPPARAPRAKRGTRTEPAADTAQELGLETVDQVLQELGEGGVMTLGPDKAALLAGAAELVRARKLRRLGNLTMALQRAAGAQRGAGMSPEEFAQTLVDLVLTREATGAVLAGRVAVDPQIAEELVGKTWRETDLEVVAGIELVEIGYRATADEEFRVETSYLADLGSGRIYTEKQITPTRLRATPKARYPLRLLVERAGLYAGASPQRIKLMQARGATLRADDVRRLVAQGLDRVADLRWRLGERLQVPFGVVEVPVLFRPADLVQDGARFGAMDADGAFIEVVAPPTWPRGWQNELPPLLPAPGAFVLCGLVEMPRGEPLLRALSVLGDLAWRRGPFYPAEFG